MSTAHLRSARRLLTRKGRKESGLMLVEGAQGVREALTSPYQVHDLIISAPGHDDLLALARDIPVWRVKSDTAKQLASTVTPPGIWAITEIPVAQWRDVPARPQLVVIASQVRDPGNAGTLIRSADAFGADAVILTTDSVEVANPKTIRASVGSVFHLPVITDVTLEEACEWARQNGLSVVATEMDGEPLNTSPVLGGPVAWVMGNEAWGLTAEQLAHVDHVMSIPMWGQAESLNLSTAAAICLYATAIAHHSPSSDGVSGRHGSGHTVSGRQGSGHQQRARQGSGQSTGGRASARSDARAGSSRGSRAEGSRSEGSRSDAPRSDAPRSGGSRSGGPRSGSSRGTSRPAAGGSRRRSR